MGGGPGGRGPVMRARRRRSPIVSSTVATQDARETVYLCRHADGSTSFVTVPR